MGVVRLLKNLIWFFYYYFFFFELCGAYSSSFFFFKTSNILIGSIPTEIGYLSSITILFIFPPPLFQFLFFFSSSPSSLSFYSDMGQNSGLIGTIPSELAILTLTRLFVFSSSFTPAVCFCIFDSHSIFFFFFYFFFFFLSGPLNKPISRAQSLQNSKILPYLTCKLFFFFFFCFCFCFFFVFFYPNPQ